MLLGVSMAEGLQWGRLLKKGAEILITGGVVAGVDASLDKSDNKQYSEHMQPIAQPPLMPGMHEDKTIGFVLMTAGSVMMGVAVLGCMITYICKQCNRRPINRTEIELSTV